MADLLNLPPYRSVLITGASSGIGAEIAKILSRQGVTLILGGRDAVRLRRVGQDCEALGARVIPWRADLGEIEPALSALAQIDDRHSLELAVLNAGIGDSCEPNGIAESPAVTARLSDINFRAPAAMASLLAERMTARKSGAICFIGSTAAWTPLPMARGYAASKAGLHMFARALDWALRPHNVFVTLVTPGFIDTPMSRRLDCRQPFLMRADRAAQSIVKSIQARKREVVIPWQFGIFRIMLKLIPDPLVRSYFARARFGTRAYDPEQ